MDAPTPNAPTPPRFDPLRDKAQMAALIAEASGVTPAEAVRRLDYELKHPGRSVADDFAARGGPRYTAGPQMDAFYAATDAFLYELAIWNRNRLKAGMRKWIGRNMARVGRPMDVLSIGDGLGFDCLHWAKLGHRVTYFELPGKSEQFARRLFDGSGAAIPMLTDPAAIPLESFDAITCLDVLEHVPNPPALVNTFASYLRPGGLMYVSAPFQLILPWYPTHLRNSRRYSGSLRMYREAGLELVGGRPGWDPVVFRKPGNVVPGNRSTPASFAIRLSAVVWIPGRFGAWPYAPLHWIRKMMDMPFPD